jgi:hypothetical protein
LPLALLFLALVAPACGSQLPEPDSAAQPVNAYKPVPYPPPAAFAEVVPRPPNDEAVWVDGYWVWRGRYYGWQRGGWVNPPPGARYARWQTSITDEGVVYFAEGRWFDAKGQPLPAPDPVREARTPPNEITPEFESAR